MQNVVLAFLFNGLGIPAAATGVVYPIWGMVAMAASVTTIFINSLWGRGAYFFQALKTPGLDVVSFQNAGRLNRFLQYVRDTVLKGVGAAGERLQHEVVCISIHDDGREQIRLSKNEPVRRARVLLNLPPANRGADSVAQQFGCRRVRIAAQQAQLDLGGGTVKGITHGVAGGVEHAHQGGAGTVEILNDVSRVHPEVTLPQAAQSRR